VESLVAHPATLKSLGAPFETAEACFSSKENSGLKLIPSLPALLRLLLGAKDHSGITTW